MDQNKKNNSLLYIVVAIIIVIVLILLVSLKNKMNVNPTNEPTIEDIELNNAITSDSTGEIQNSLDQIDVTDTTAKDLEDVDKDLNSL